MCTYRIETTRGPSDLLVHVPDKHSAAAGLLAEASQSARSGVHRESCAGPDVDVIVVDVSDRASDAAKAVERVLSDRSSSWIIAVGPMLGLAERRALSEGRPVEFLAREELTQALLLGTIRWVGERSAGVRVLAQGERWLADVQRMEALRRAVGEFSHAFNNALTITLGHANLLDMSPELPDSLRAAVEQITEGSTQAAELVGPLLRFARKDPKRFDPVRVDELIESVLATARCLLGDRIRLRKDVATSSVVVRADRDRLLLSLLALAIGARQAMPYGGEVTFRAESAQGPPGESHLSAERCVKISVSDTGRRREQSDLRAVREPLSICEFPDPGAIPMLAGVRSTVLYHGGVIEAEACPQGGTRFDIYLPVAGEYRAEPGGPDTQAQGDRPRRVIVADDEEAVRDVVSAAFARKGVEIICCHDGQEAVERFEREQGRVDLVLLDMIMPRMDGRETFQHIHRRAPWVPVLLFSGFSVDEAAQKCLAGGARGFITKPFHVAELVDQVEQLLAETAPDRAVSS